MDQRRQVQHKVLVAQLGGHRESCWMQNENPCGSPFTWEIHRLEERE